jgi:hypothetical protein
LTYKLGAFGECTLPIANAACCEPAEFDVAEVREDTRLSYVLVCTGSFRASAFTRCEVVSESVRDGVWAFLLVKMAR